MDDVAKIVKEIQESKRPNKHDYFEQKYPEFAEKYERLFEVACERKLDLQQLSVMLRLADKVKSEEVSQHEASVAIGQNLYNQYVRPKLAKKS